MDDSSMGGAAPKRLGAGGMAVKEFAILEWLWGTYVVFCLLFYWFTRYEHGFFIMVAFYCVEFPLSFWVGGWQFEALLPGWVRIYFAVLIAAANGGLYYALARLFFRLKRPAVAGR